MNTDLTSGLRSAALAVTLSFATAITSAKNAVPADLASDLLERHGTIAVRAAGPHVEIGSFLIQVTTKLGRPGARLPDGTLLYHDYRVENSDALGTLVVRFAQGRVSGMSLVTPAVATTMMTPASSLGKIVQ